MELQQQLHDLAAYCSQLVAQTIEEDEREPLELLVVSKEMQRLQPLWHKWRLIYVEQYASMLEHPLGAQVFSELMHLWSLVCRPVYALENAEDSLSVSRHLLHPSWVITIHSYGKAADFPWDVPVQCCTQSETIFLAMFLSQHAMILKESCVSEFRQMFDALFYRTAVLSQECHPAATLDAPDMRECVDKAADCWVVNMKYREFCHCYLGSIMRMLFYHDELRKKPFLGERWPQHTNLVAGTRIWLKHIVNKLASEAFEDSYVTCPDAAYGFLGDDPWFRFAFPEKVHSRPDCLMELRPHLYNPYFNEAKTTKTGALGKYNEDRVARLFMLKAVSEYIQTKSAGDINWFNTVVREPDDLSTSASLDFQLGQVAPLLFCALGVWPYQAGHFYVTDDLAESIAIWFALCEQHYDSTICGCDMRPFLREIRDAATGAQQIVHSMFV
jgi:hypothetical protein